MYQEICVARNHYELAFSSLHYHVSNYLLNKYTHTTKQINYLINVQLHGTESILIAVRMLR